MSLLEEEIAAIPALVQPCLQGATAGIQQARELWRMADPVALFTVARGSADASATYGAYRIASATGIVVGSFMPSLSSVGDFVHNRGSGLLALGISQSGASPDIVKALQAFPEATRIALTNIDDSPMEQVARLRLPIGVGAEISVAATKSFACTLLLLDALASAWSNETPTDPTLLADAAAQGCATPADLNLLINCTHCYTIGRGPTLALAQEAALKLKECAGLHAEALSSAEVHHGPKEIVGPSLPLLAFVPAGKIGMHVEKTLMDLTNLGSPVLVLGASDDPHELPGILRSLCAFYTALPALAHARGRDPEKPAHLNKITRTT